MAKRVRITTPSTNLFNPHCALHYSIGTLLSVVDV
jgi:hypothetical protein